MFYAGGISLPDQGAGPPSPATIRRAGDTVECGSQPSV